MQSRWTENFISNCSWSHREKKHSLNLDKSEEEFHQQTPGQRLGTFVCQSNLQNCSRGRVSQANVCNDSLWIIIHPPHDSRKWLARAALSEKTRNIETRGKCTLDLGAQCPVTGSRVAAGEGQGWQKALSISTKVRVETGGGWREGAANSRHCSCLHSIIISSIILLKPRVTWAAHCRSGGS